MDNLYLHFVTYEHTEPEARTWLRISRTPPDAPQIEKLFTGNPLTLSPSDAARLWPILKEFSETGRPPAS